MPYFYPRRIKIQELKVSDLEDFYKYLVFEKSKSDGSEPLSPTTITHIHRCISKALNDAARKGIITVNVATLADSADTPFRLKNADLPPLSYPEMRTAADALCGTHDFTSFTSDKTPGKSHVRRIDSVTVDTVTLPSGIELLRFTFCGNGFLYNMVRILSGTLLSVFLLYPSVREASLLK